MIFAGAGGHARVLYDCLKACGETLAGVIDPGVKSFYGLPVRPEYDPGFYPDHPLIVAIGDNRLRFRVAREIKHAFGILVHPSAIVAPTVSLGEGSVVLHGAIIQAECRIGRHVIINTAASVDHNCEIGDYAQIAPGAILCGGVKVGEGTLIAAGAVVTPNIRIGKWCTVGAGAVVLKDIPDGSKVYGVPGKLVG